MDKLDSLTFWKHDSPADQMQYVFYLKKNNEPLLFLIAMKRIKGFEIWRPGDSKKQPNNNITIVYVYGTSKQYVNKHVNMTTRDCWTLPVHTFLWAFKEYTLGSLVEEIRDITK